MHEQNKIGYTRFRKSLMKMLIQRLTKETGILTRPALLIAVWEMSLEFYSVQFIMSGTGGETSYCFDAIGTIILIRTQFLVYVLPLSLSLSDSE